MHGESDRNVPALGKPQRTLLPLNEAAYDLGGITERELYNRINAGDLELIKIGRRSFIPRVSIDTYVQRLREESAQRRGAVAPDAA